jgi:hypothetical protein
MATIYIESYITLFLLFLLIKLFFLKEKFGYCDTNGVFVLLHAFQKRTLKIPKREIRIAVERMKADQKKKGG